MLIEETRECARKVFEQWFKIFARKEECENKERLFEFFHSGYLAGTRHGSGIKSQRDQGSLIQDDVNRNLDI